MRNTLCLIMLLLSFMWRIVHMMRITRSCSMLPIVCRFLMKFNLMTRSILFICELINLIVQKFYNFLCIWTNGFVLEASLNSNI
uniref:Candidate secreted effector n=1 Tax=Meloidogyne incognita TaxID=6306 RepID=A0A914LBZ5_MELIC